jgi:hypothetical protein
MSDLLFLASDYIERMANPVYGTSTNEDYALKFATLLSKEEFEARLNEEIRTLTDRETLTSYGWLWLFGWAKSRDIDLKEDLLIDLYEEWSSVFVRAEIVDLATHNVDYPERPNALLSMGEFPNRFLSRIMSQATRRPEAEETQHLEAEDRGSLEEQRAPEQGPSTALAESTLVALIQVGTPITIDAARVLLWHKWEGQENLLELFWAICNALDPETREVWIKRLQPPPIKEARLG